jgi:hypothetical protein
MKYCKTYHTVSLVNFVSGRKKLLQLPNVSSYSSIKSLHEWNSLIMESSHVQITDYLSLGLMSGCDSRINHFLEDHNHFTFRTCIISISFNFQRQTLPQPPNRGQYQYCIWLTAVRWHFEPKCLPFLKKVFELSWQRELCSFTLSIDILLVFKSNGTILSFLHNLPSVQLRLCHKNSQQNYKHLTSQYWHVNRRFLQ